VPFQVRTIRKRIRTEQVRRLALAIGVCLLWRCAAFSQGPPPDLIQRVDNTEIARETQIAGYHVTEHYSVFRNGDSQPAAYAVVDTVYKRGEGKVYTVTSRTGSSFLQKNLIDRVLAEAGNISKGDLRKSVLITSANYEMEFQREEPMDGRDCFLIKLTAKRKSPYLINGQVWVDSANYNIMRIQGKPSAMASIWAGYPMIRRDYQELHGFSLAKESSSESKNFFLGTTVLKIDYQNYQITPDTQGIAQAK
jgi:hypothetical protein